MPALIGTNYLGRYSRKIEWQCVLILGVTHGKKYFCERPRSPMAARGATRAGRGTSPSTRRDAGSHSVDRIVRVFSFLSGLTPAGKVFGNGSDSGGLGNRHLIEVYFCGVCVIAMGGIKPKPRFDGNEYISAKLAPLQWVRGKSCPLRLGRFTLGVNLEKSNSNVC
jgi:hypothetical protein